MEAHGWGRHLRDVRSFEKLTSAGMTFLDVDVIRILDEILPARLGGVPGQYQLIEDEPPDGRPRVRLLVPPALGVVDPALTREIFLAALASGSDTHRSMASTWREAGLVEVKPLSPFRSRSARSSISAPGGGPRSPAERERDQDDRAGEVVQQGLGVSIAPRLALPDQFPGAVYRPFEPRAPRRIALAMRDIAELSPVARAFVELAERWAKRRRPSR
jgi:DNA-binding transcriptional LysR family regulator